MPARYRPDEHLLLSDAAAALDPDNELEAHAVVAEAVLGLSAADVITDADAVEIATSAVALQVNLQVARAVDATRADVVQESKGDQSFSYARTKSGAPIDVDGVAQKLAAQALRSLVSLETIPTPPPASSSTPIQFAW